MGNGVSVDSASSENTHRRQQKRRQDYQNGRNKGQTSPLLSKNRNVKNQKLNQDTDSSYRAGISEYSSGSSKARTWLNALRKQNYSSIIQECSQDKQLWRDPLFLANDSAIYVNGNAPFKITWMRPGEITNTASFYVSGASRFDLVQGDLGDCWLLAAAGAVADRDELVGKIIPDHRKYLKTEGDGFDTKKGYCGVFRFRFFVYNEWLEVCIDDRLPTYQGRLIMVHSSDKHEFWAALLEKAYAKLFGCYEALKGGVCGDALTDLTGGVCETYLLKSSNNYVNSGGDIDLAEWLQRAARRGALLCTGIWSRGTVNEETLSNGLVAGHAYTISDVAKVLSLETPFCWHSFIVDPHFIKYLCVWKDIPNGLADQLKHSLKDDGEFWMEYKDFSRNFDDVDVCHLVPDELHTLIERFNQQPQYEEDSGLSLLENILVGTQIPCAERNTVSRIFVYKLETLTQRQQNAIQWKSSVHQKSWKGRSAGGRAKFAETFHHNPQIEVFLMDSAIDKDQSASLLVELMQKYRRHDPKMQNLNVGFVIYEMQNGDQLPCDREFFQKRQRVGSVDYYVNLRSVSKRFMLPPGRYVIVCSTWEQGVEGDFMLRVWSEAEHRTVDADNHKGLGLPPDCRDCDPFEENDAFHETDDKFCSADVR